MTIKVNKFRSAAEARDHTKRGGGGGGLQSVPKEGCTVRFLTEPEEWIAFSEMYDADNQAYLPLADEDTVPSGARISTRYVANVLWQSDGVMQGKVVSFKMPKKVAIALLNKYDKYGTMTDRDYEVARYGEGTNTEYDVTPESPSKVNIKKYELLDLIEKLTEERERALGRIEGGDGDKKPAAKGKSKAKDEAPAKKATKAAPKRGDDDEDEDGNDDIDFNSLGEGADDGDEECMEALTEAAEAADLDPNDFDTWVELAEALAANGDEDDDEEDADEDEEAEDDEDEEDEEEAIDPAALKKLATKADKGDEEAQESLTEYAEQVELDPDDFDTWKELVEAIIEAASGDEDEDEEAEEEEGDDDEVEIDLDTLNGMSLGDLRKLADDFDIEHKGLTKKALIQAIVDSAEE